jgi:hypothetical protein
LEQDMSAGPLTSRLKRKVGRMLGEPDALEIMRRYRVRSEADRAKLAECAQTPIAELFFAHRGRKIQKLAHYLPIYEKYFGPYRNTPVKMLEIGVNKGGSLDLWRKYFGKDATIFGVDINPDCAGVVTAPNQVRIGSQDDPQFLLGVISEMGAPDIILDDGSHVGRHQCKSFEILFPKLKTGGLYVIEDLCTAYWPGEWEGGYRRTDTAIGLVKRMIDDMHAWYHNVPAATPAKDEIGAIHIYNSIVVIEKTKTGAPSDVVLG